MVVWDQTGFPVGLPRFVLLFSTNGVLDSVDVYGPSNVVWLYELGLLPSAMRVAPPDDPV
jgi:hypothetical protein